MPVSISSLQKWITERREEHLRALPGSPGFEQCLEDLHRYKLAESVINEYIDDLQRNSFTSSGSVTSSEVMEHDLPGMWEHADFMGDYQGVPVK